MLAQLLMEFIGTAIFIFIIISTGNPIFIGASLALLILVAQNISGGHFNPAVSITMAVANNLPTTELLPYLIAQILGALLALEIYKRVKA